MPSPPRDCKAEFRFLATAVSRSLRAPMREGQELVEPPSQETGEIRNLRECSSHRTTFRAPAREGAEEEMKLLGFFRFFILLLVFLSCQTSPLAQNNSADAAISGTIVDSTGSAIGGVAVTATEAETHRVTASVTSKPDGSYNLTVPVGRYRVRFVRAPFSPIEEVVDVGAGEPRDLSARLTLERLSSSVVVTAQAEPTLLEQATAPVSIISREEIEARQSVDLPSALLFVPGIAIGRTGAEGGTASVFLNGGNSNFTKVLGGGRGGWGGAGKF